MRKAILFLCALFTLLSLFAAKDKTARRKEKREAFLRRQTRQAKIPQGWATSLDEGIKAAKKDKPILVFITSTQSYSSSRALDRKVIQVTDFQSEIKTYASVVYLDYPKNCKDEKVLADVKKCTFFHGKVPCIGIVDAKMNVLAQPKSFTRQGIVLAARQASRKMAKEALKHGDDEEEKEEEEKEAVEKSSPPVQEKKKETTEKTGGTGKTVTEKDKVKESAKTETDAKKK